ncbi:biliverdin-producing heme oxygenase [uncultured Algimonas sp.]|uniref:biliverdin-producing heme oxygenase n=1 Tax=uncultured Algimonas sp. TaxID=1547920 RepID=UPI00260CDDBF|nr:biliverdin-producing heme oxygenase [uncultured Algimonas sp.]
MSELRQRLRRDTADSHNRIDARMGSLDLTTVGGLSKLLSAHYLVQSLFGALADERLEFLPELRRDLDALGTARPVWTDPPGAQGVHPLGYRYVVSGSHMGARLLHRDWMQARDPQVRAAGRYLQANLDSRAWPDLLAEMKAADPAAIDADHVVASANRVFEAYDRAATELGIGRGGGGRPAAPPQSAGVGPKTSD